MGMDVKAIVTAKRRLDKRKRMAVAEQLIICYLTIDFQSRSSDASAVR